MTREEFNEMYDFGELIRLCAEYNLPFCDEIILQDDLDERICDDIVNEVRGNTWDDIRDALNDIEYGRDAYVRNGSLNYETLDYDYDYESYQSSVRDAMEERGYFDDDPVDYDPFDDELLVAVDWAAEESPRLEKCPEEVAPELLDFLSEFKMGA